MSKPASLLVVSLGKTLNGMPPSFCGREVAEPGSLPVVVACLIVDKQNGLMKAHNLKSFSTNERSYPHTKKKRHSMFFSILIKLDFSEMLFDFK